MQDNIFNSYYRPSYYNDERLITYVNPIGTMVIHRYMSNNRDSSIDYENTCKKFVGNDESKFIRNTYGERIVVNRLVKYHKEMDKIRKLRGIQ